jgi:hypothetical protein
VKLSSWVSHEFPGFAAGIPWPAKKNRYKHYSSLRTNVLQSLILQQTCVEKTLELLIACHINFRYKQFSAWRQDPRNSAASKLEKATMVMRSALYGALLVASVEGFQPSTSFVARGVAPKAMTSRSVKFHNSSLPFSQTRTFLCKMHLWKHASIHVHDSYMFSECMHSNDVNTWRLSAELQTHRHIRNEFLFDQHYTNNLLLEWVHIHM